MSQVVREFYDKGVEAEWVRLTRPFHQIELHTTLMLIDRFIRAGSVVAEVGAGPGRYTLELLRRGHEVVSVELSSSAVAFAKARIGESHFTRATLHVGDARDLSMLPTAGFDAAIHLGPMYHLVAEHDRAAALSGLRRILKPSGIALVAYLNAWGILRTALIDMPGWFNDNRASLLMEPRGWPANELVGFTEAFFSTPGAAHEELTKHGFEVLTYVGSEGFAGGMKRTVEALAAQSSGLIEKVVQQAIATCEHPAYRDATDHLCFVVRRRP